MHRLNPFILSLHISFAYDLPITITPDILWIVITQGFAQHINKNAEKYPKSFVDFKGKKEITIVRNEFFSDITTNDWSTIFPEFTEKISKIIGDDKTQLVVQDFTTTNIYSKMAMQTVLMGTLQNYFEYTVLTRCGIPEFNILGDIYDYKKILTKIQEYKNVFDLDWWVNKLEDIITKFMNIVDPNKESDVEWLNSFYKFETQSGGDIINGHVLGLFSYLKNEDGDFVQNNPNSTYGEYIEVKTNSFPSGITSVPFLFDYLGNHITMNIDTFGIPIFKDGTVTLEHLVNVYESKNI